MKRTVILPVVERKEFLTVNADGKGHCFTWWGSTENGFQRDVPSDGH